MSKPIDYSIKTFDLLKKMNSEKKVYPEIIDLLSYYKDDFKKIEKYWLNIVDVDIKNAFVMYYASRNMKLITEMMIKRFKLKSENPRIIEDAMLIIPRMFEVHDILTSITKDKLSKPITSMLLRYTRTMRKIAKEYDLLPSIQEEIDKLDKDNVNRLSKAFSNKLAGILVENKGNA